VDLSLRKQVESTTVLGAPRVPVRGPETEFALVKALFRESWSTTHGFSQDGGLSFDGLSGSLAAVTRESTQPPLQVSHLNPSLSN
jgi:hypothetical protein